MKQFLKYKRITENKVKKWLRNTDWMVINAEGILTLEQVEEIKIFRQALRDINKIHPSDHTKWIFPNLPSWVRLCDLED